MENRTQCPLCLEDFKKEKLQRRHLAHELEQVALVCRTPSQNPVYMIDPNSDEALDLMEDSGTDGETQAESVALEAPEGSITQAEGLERLL